MPGTSSTCNAMLGLRVVRLILPRRLRLRIELTYLNVRLRGDWPHLAAPTQPMEKPREHGSSRPLLRQMILTHKYLLEQA